MPSDDEIARGISAGKSMDDRVRWVKQLGYKIGDAFRYAENSYRELDQAQRTIEGMRRQIAALEHKTSSVGPDEKPLLDQRNDMLGKMNRARRQVDALSRNVNEAIAEMRETLKK